MIGYNPTIPGGTDPESVWKRSVEERLRALRIVEVPNATVERTNRGTKIIPKAIAIKGGSAPAKPTTFILKLVMGDYLVCDGGGELDVKIAKNPKLRNSILMEDLPSIDGLIHATYEYTSTEVRVATFHDPGSGLTITETQVIVPRYLLGDQILAMKVTGSTSVDDPDVEGTKIPWIDLNNDARAWSRSYA